MAGTAGEEGNFELRGQLVTDDTDAVFFDERNTRRITLPLAEESPDDWTRRVGTRVETTRDFSTIALASKSENFDILAVYLDRRNHVLAVVPHRASALATMATWVPAEMRAHAAEGVAFTVTKQGGLYEKAIRSARPVGSARVVDVVEVGARDYRSAVDERKWTFSRVGVAEPGRFRRVQESPRPPYGPDRPADRRAEGAVRRDEFGRFLSPTDRAADAFNRSPRGEVADLGAAQAPLLARSLSPHWWPPVRLPRRTEGPAKGLIWGLAVKVRPDRPVAWTQVRDALANVTHD